MTALPKPTYVMSEPHLSGWRVILGYETLADAQAAQSAVSAPEAREGEAVGQVNALYASGFGRMRCIEWAAGDMPEVGTKLFTHPAAPSADKLRIAVEALERAEVEFEAIRLVLINHLNEPERAAFWKAVYGRASAQDTLAALKAGAK